MVGKADSPCLHFFDSIPMLDPCHRTDTLFLLIVNLASDPQLAKSLFEISLTRLSEPIRLCFPMSANLLSNNTSGSIQTQADVALLYSQQVVQQQAEAPMILESRSFNALSRECTWECKSHTALFYLNGPSVLKSISSHIPSPGMFSLLFSDDPGTLSTNQQQFLLLAMR